MNEQNNSVKQRNTMLHDKISKLVCRMALPSIIMQVVTLIYNTVDTYFISQIDKSAAAAVGTVFTIQAVIQAVGFGFGMGVSSLCSRKLGEADDNSANTYATSGIIGSFFTAIIIACLGLLFLRPLLVSIGCSETMLPYAISYSLLILLFAPLSCITFVVNNILKAEGHINLSMIGNLVGTIINVILDPVLIFKADLGTGGAALATGLSQATTFLIMYSLFLRGKTVIHIHPKYISRSVRCYFDIITTGIPTFFRQGLASVATALLCSHATLYGDAVVAAVTIANKVYMLIRGIILGLGQGTQPVAGYNFGAGLYRRAKASFDFAIKIGTIACLVFTAFVYCFARDIMWWFCEDSEVLSYGVHALHFAALVIPALAFSTIVNQEFQCLGFKTQASILASCRQGICFIPVIFIAPYFLGVTGVEAAQPLSDLFTFLISIPFYFQISNILKHDPNDLH